MSQIQPELAVDLYTDEARARSLPNMTRNASGFFVFISDSPGQSKHATTVRDVRNRDFVFDFRGVLESVLLRFPKLDVAGVECPRPCKPPNSSPGPAGQLELWGRAWR